MANALTNGLRSTASVASGDFIAAIRVNTQEAPQRQGAGVAQPLARWVARSGPIRD